MVNIFGESGFFIVVSPFCCRQPRRQHETKCRKQVTRSGTFPNNPLYKIKKMHELTPLPTSFSYRKPCFFLQHAV
ncbi:hypothetical protein XB02_17235 [Pantoea ananatis]|nr:hypothetical protein XB02_17235 [Pantoea ananatis]